MLSIGIVGLPNVGKSTLFNALTKQSVAAENFPFCTIDPSVGVVGVPDERLERLSAISQSAKTIPTAIEFVDIAGLVKGAAEGQGLGNQFLAHIREVDAIAEVVRVFEGEDVVHVEGKIDPLDDIEVINLELILADQATIAKRRGSIVREVKRGEKAAVAEDGILARLDVLLGEGKLAREAALNTEESVLVRGLHLLTMKPILYVLNRMTLGENIAEDDERYTRLMAFFRETGAHYVTVDAGIEHDLKDLDGVEKQTLRDDVGAGDDGINALIRVGYEMLGLSTFFTTGETETRAWTVKRGAAAPEAGAAIHTDFRDKFIRAEVYASADLITHGSVAKLRELGLVRVEGKEYVVKDGDVMVFRHG